MGFLLSLEPHVVSGAVFWAYTTVGAQPAPSDGPLFALDVAPTKPGSAPL